jgi:hypothetical protein
MNYSTAVFLINPKVRAVICTYEAEEKAPQETFKTLDESISIGDIVVVPTNTRHKMTCVKVVAVDVDINFDSQVEMKWVVGVLDQTPHNEVLAMENKAIQAIKSAELRKKRDELRAALILDAEQIKTLEITSAGE